VSLLIILRPGSAGLTTVSVSRGTTWQAAAQVGPVRASTWAVRETVAVTRLATWDVLKFVQTPRNARYAVRERVTTTRAASWDALARTTATRASTWAVLAPVAQTRATTWAVLTPTTLTRAATWDALAQTTTTRGTTWQAPARVSKFRQTFWDALTTTTATRGTSWAVAGANIAVGTSRDTTWSVTTTTTATRATTWAAAATTATTRGTSWATSATATTTRSTTWAAAQTTTATRAATWNALARVSKFRQTFWNTLTTAAATRATTWAVAGTNATVGTARDTSWAAHAATTAARTTTWAAQATITTASVTTWTALARVSKFRATTWAAPAPAGTTRAAIWDTLARVTTTRTIGYGVTAPPPTTVTTSRSTTWAVLAAATPVDPVEALAVPFPWASTPPPTLIGFTVVVRNNALQRIGAIHVKSLSFTPRFNDVGEWTLTVHADMPMAKALEVPGAGVLIYRNADMTTPLMTGPVRSRALRLTDDGYELTVGGPDDNTFLADRVAYQMPTRTAPNQGTPSTGAVPRDVQTGAAETVIKHYVEANGGQTALTPRRIVTVVPVAGAGRGATVTGSARMRNLLSLIQGLAGTGGLGFNVRQIGQNLTFDVYTPIDRTGTARFASKLGNLDSFELTETAPAASYVIAGGTGGGTTRIFRDMTDTDAITAWPRTRVERYINQSTDDPAELDQALAEELLSNGPATSMALTTRDTPQIQFARDYYVGDKVTVEPRPGQVIRDILREVTVTWDPDTGVQAVSRVGSYATTGTNRIIRLVQRLQKAAAGPVT
jgi:hypothetical protein